VIGIYVVGSATRPHRDPLSDLDIEVVMEDDAHDALPPEERHLFVIAEGPPRRVDHEFYVWPWSGFVSLVDSRQDHFHYPYQHACILHDPAGRVRPVVEALARLPEEVRTERMRVHLLEWVFGLGRARKTLQRSLDLDGRLVAADAVRGLVKLLFLAAGSWPSTRHWTGPELSQLGVPETIREGMRQVLAAPDPTSFGELHGRVADWLDGRGLSLHRDVPALTRWAFLTREGQEAFERWGGS
jgi:hypothetical protein